ncbi:hypothetical protein [Streptomyces graminilatus]|uniref:hypothetical protein n=1 Tax=Streptomyces graminilatus TaxID=1464070 RepID=UPI0006E35333|nr:hypothetical protein [Streptomyces graminilatus]
MARWIMALGERTDSNNPRYAEMPAPKDARAVALVEKFEHLFNIMNQWSELYGAEFTVWAETTTAERLEDASEWSEEDGPHIRMDRMEGGFITVSDYRMGRCISPSNAVLEVRA